MLVCKPKDKENCTIWCAHHGYHTVAQCKKIPVCRTKCGRTNGMCHEVLPKHCRKCEFLQNKHFCLLSRENCEDIKSCIKGKLRVEDIILILNEIIPHVFTDPSLDATMAAAGVKYPNYRLTTKNFLKGEAENGLK